MLSWSVKARLWVVVLLASDSHVVDKPREQKSDTRQSFFESFSGQERGGIVGTPEWTDLASHLDLS